MDTPSSMQPDLAAWNGGNGIELESWLSCSGSYALATGYCTLFWPDFVEVEGYELKGPVSVSDVRKWEDGARSRAAVEWVMNHDHLAHLHPHDKDVSKDKLLVLGKVLRDLYETKLRSQFPDKTFVVEFKVPADEDDLMDYQLAFWQTANERLPTPKAPKSLG